MQTNKTILFNPRSATAKHRIPNSILQVGAAIHGKFDYVFVDGNREQNPLEKIDTYLQTGEFRYFGCSVMPGPQLREAITITKFVRENYPNVIIIWGGYFASNQHKVVLDSGAVDFVIDGPGDYAFPQLLGIVESFLRAHPVVLNSVAADTRNRVADYENDLVALQQQFLSLRQTLFQQPELSQVENLIYKQDEKIHKAPKAVIPDYNLLPPLPYSYLNEFYSLEKYLVKTFLGNRTLAYHSSFGCPFTCSFCGIVPIYEARWKAKSAENIFKDVLWMKENFGADAVEFHDNNFFVSEKRTVEFAKLMLNQGMQWWGEARIDTMHKYKDESLALLRESGCTMIFFGAETGNDSILEQIDKGGTQTGAQILQFAERLKRFDIIPEYSFVLGFPAKTPEIAMTQIQADIRFIKEVKAINPATEIIIYVYSPVPTEGSDLFEEVKKAGFHFPQTLEDWLEPAWEKFDLRKNPLTPWLNAEMIDTIKNFETVLNGFYPTVSDIQLTTWKRKLIQNIARFRYEKDFYHFPYEIKVLQKIWRYRQPEIEGF